MIKTKCLSSFCSLLSTKLLPLGPCTCPLPSSWGLPTYVWLSPRTAFLGEGTRAVCDSLTCGGQGHRNPKGGSQLAPGSSQTSLALCGTPPAAEDPVQRAAPPEGQRVVVPWDTLGQGVPDQSRGTGLRASGEGQVQRNQLSRPLNTRAGRK